MARLDGKKLSDVGAPSALRCLTSTLKFSTGLTKPLRSYFPNVEDALKALEEMKSAAAKELSSCGLPHHQIGSFEAAFDTLVGLGTAINHISPKSKSYINSEAVGELSVLMPKLRSLQIEGAKFGG
ncbi:hypothetical protein EON82_00885 [bacterium]|nr:MAG: hypothetical protein EON82_00885 [bacterium]